MQVVCPYHPQVHPRTERALRAFAPHARLFALSHHPHSYYQFFCERWQEGEGFPLVEHDIELHADVLPQLEACESPWCIFPYQGPPNTIFARSLGCTRFSTELIRTRGSLAVELECRDWRRMDTAINYNLQQLGYQPCIHEPIVKHHHVYADGCACGEDHQ